MRSTWKIDEITDFACLTVNREVVNGSGAMPTVFHLDDISEKLPELHSAMAALLTLFAASAGFQLSGDTLRRQQHHLHISQCRVPG